MTPQKRTLVLSHCPPEPPWSGERRLVAAATGFFSSLSEVDLCIVQRDDTLLHRVANKVKAPVAPPYAARFSNKAHSWEGYDYIWVFEVWAMSCVPRAIVPRVLWDKDTLMGDSFLQQASSPARRITAHWISIYERALLSRVRWAFMSNPDEVASVALPRVSFLPHGITRIHPRALGWQREGAVVLGFAGLLAYSPNRNGLLAFVRQAYLAARRAGTRMGRTLELVVAGEGLSRSERDLLGSYPDVTLLGYVEDIGDFYEKIDIALAPMTQGAGAATKVVEALAHGVPVIGTAIGLRGVDRRLREWTVDLPADPILWLRSLRRAGELVETPRRDLNAVLEDFVGDRVFNRVVAPVMRT